MLRNSSRVKRKELLSPFNFAAFYLPYVLRESKRVLYLDTDVIVEGDVGALHDLDMQGFPAAAVEDCSQQVFKYINFDLLRKYDADSAPPYEPEEPGTAAAWTRWSLADTLSNTTCVFNRGVVLFDCARWRELRLTETIEDLVDAFVESHAKLWRGGISQPPFLLTLTGRYLKLDLEWNVRGLGRIDLGRNEWMLLADHTRKKYGTEPGVFERHMAPSGPFRHTFTPYLCPFAAKAKILHFNGELKPWMLSARDTEAWRHVGLNVSRSGADGVREVLSTCNMAACPTSVNITTGRRVRSACEAWIKMPWFNGRKTRWDQQHFSPSGLRWSTKVVKTVADYYEAGCHARPPLCSCNSDLSDDCVTSCASHWHRYVSPKLFGQDHIKVAWSNESFVEGRRLDDWNGDTPEQGRRLYDWRRRLYDWKTSPGSAPEKGRLDDCK
ncbi:nucleotide-diphospho-sugar transferase [Pelagophyceae sp. CCMP2097]|nr:nucleotide-diphospho-sugar transferase [Pelagophyceae sp. CCMP2097]